ncbi:Protein MODIFIER OF SNC1 1 [Sesbania bispinosa]|nr:Protein MODIFIER OF SNC1 1 [Sesbania bispinosa]
MGSHIRSERDMNLREIGESPPHDNRHHNQPKSGKVTVRSLHYEYHPVGPNDDSRADNLNDLKMSHQLSSEGRYALSRTRSNEDDVVLWGAGKKKSFDG